MIRTKSEIKTFWIVFLTVLSALAIAFAAYREIDNARTLAYMLATTVREDDMYRIQAENNYKQALYSVTDSLKNMDADLTKATVSRDGGIQTERLLNVVSQANNVTANVAHLPITQSDTLLKLEKFANQAGDFSASLLKKLQRGEEVTAEDKASLTRLDATCSALHLSLRELLRDKDGMFITDGLRADGTGVMDDFMDELDENVFGYEKLIYDGPFSDNVKEAEVVTSRTVSHEEGKNIVSGILEGAEVTFEGEINKKGRFFVYRASTEAGEGRVLLAADGRLAELNFYPQEKAATKKLSEQECIDIAEKFCNDNGFDVKGVWINRFMDSVTYVNLAPVKEGVVYYPDLVKVAIGHADGKVVALESRAYLTNHRQRDVVFGSLTEEEAKGKLDGMLAVKNVAKALVEKDGEEYACYEFECEEAGNQYFVYIDSVNGKEREIFKVISGTEGYTVM